MIITRTISLTNFFVATSALGFQVFVLYPWHKQLDDDFEALKREHLRILDVVEDTGIEVKKGIREQLSQLSTRTMSLTPASAAYHAVDMTKKTAASAADKFQGISLYARYALAGALCCSFTHAVLTPVDVVKTRIQLEPGTYNRGLLGGLRQAVANDGASALLVGLQPTIAGYFLQGAFKFGGYEFFKQHVIDWLGHETASRNRLAVYIASSATAEFLGDIALCPFEAVRIRLVSDPAFARGLWDGFNKMASQEGIAGLYSGLGPILLKQIPYTMATFVVYEKSLELVYKSVDKSALSKTALTGVHLGSGLLAGIAATLVSQPADTMLSKINMEKGQPGEGTVQRLIKIATHLGVRGSYAGVRARLMMVGGMTAAQFAIYGDIKEAIGATGGIEIISLP